MTRDLLLAIGILLTTASQFRSDSAPIGPGELCLVIWIALTLGREALRLEPRFTPAFSRLVIFRLFFGLAQCIGTLTGYAIADVHGSVLFIHDAMAYPLLAAISILSAAGLDAGYRMHRVTWLLVTLGSAMLAPQVLQAWDVISIGSLDPWYWDRMRGWSDNPNQLAFLCAVLTLLSLHLADVATSAPARIAAIASGILPVYVGRLTKSDTRGLVLLAAGPIFIALKLRTWLLHQPSLSFRAAFAWFAVFALPLLIVFAVPFARSLSSDAEAFAGEMAKGTAEDTENTAQVRFAAWRRAFDRGLESGMPGLGPGPHLPIPAIILAGREAPSDEPKYLEHPTNNGRPNFEAQDTPLDLFTQGGLLAVLAFLWLLATTALQTYRARLDGLTTLLGGLTIFITLHPIVHHPNFWLAISICLVAAEDRKLRLTRAWSR